MADIRRGFGDEGGQRLPWLEPVEDEDDYPAPRGGGWLKWALIGIVILGIAIAAAVLLRGWHAQRSDIGTLITADPAPYKVRPSDPGGLKVDNNDRVAQRTGTGGDINSPLDLAAIPEQPIVGAGAPAQPRPQPAAPSATPPPTAAPPARATATRPAVVAPAPPKVAEAAPAPPPAAAPATGGGSTVQLGAFSSEAKANAAWKTLSKRFSYLSPLTPVISPVKSGETTLYRLRASGGPAGSICARLRVAGEACAVAN